MTPTTEQALECLNDALDCAGEAIEDHEYTAVTAGDIRTLLDHVATSEARIQELTDQVSYQSGRAEGAKKMAEMFKALLADRDALLAEVGEALEPFAEEYAPWCGSGFPNDERVYDDITIADLKRAATVFQAIKGSGG